MHSPTGKSYIGQTRQEPIIRWRHHKKPASSGASYLARAIQKHGAHSFTFTVIACTTSQENADNLEKHFIAEHKTLAPAGYNCDAGGRAQRGERCEEYKHKQRQIPRPGQQAGFKHKDDAKLVLRLHGQHTGKPVYCVETAYEYSSTKSAARVFGLFPQLIAKRAKEGKPYKGLNFIYRSVA